jgi:hypothetical protein
MHHSSGIRPQKSLCDKTVHSKGGMHPTSRRFSHHRQVVWDRFCCPFCSRKTLARLSFASASASRDVTLRFTFALDSLELAAFLLDVTRRLSNAVKAGEREARALRAFGRLSHNRSALCVQHSCHQSASRPACLAVVKVGALLLQCSAADETPSVTS